MGIREERKRATIARILEAAGVEFAERGYDATSYASIAARAGVAKSLVSYHFATKSAIAEMVVDASFSEDTFLNTAMSADGPLADIIQSTAAVARAYSENPLARASLRLITENHEAEQAAPAPYVGWVTRTADDLRAAAAQGLITLGVDTHREAVILVSVFVGLRNVTDILDEQARFVELVVTTIRQRLVFLGADEAVVAGIEAEPGRE